MFTFFPARPYIRKSSRHAATPEKKTTNETIQQTETKTEEERVTQEIREGLEVHVRLAAKDWRMMSQAVASAAYALQHPPAEILVSRLDQIDHRLRQLEEKQHPPPLNDNYQYTPSVDLQKPWTSRHHPSRSLSSALHEVHLKGTLMDRLSLLETRIQQLSTLLEDKGSSGPAAGASAIRQTNEHACTVQQAAKQPDAGGAARIVGGGPWMTGEIFQSGAPELRSRKPARSSKVKDPCKDALISVETRGTSNCRDEKKRLEHSRFYKRWFPVGC